jgi:predicted ATPase/class 3 adenylate cyclase/DNA-binding CsgD family transcriptional regulator
MVDVVGPVWEEAACMVDDVGRGVAWPVLLVEAAVSGAEVRPFALPTGTVTFLMTDVEGSTRRWEEAPAAMAVAIPRHYELLAEAISRHGGVRPVEQGEGDSVVGAFSRASDAVAAALAAQRALSVEQWPTGAVLRVRMAVHTGEAQVGGEGSYVGHALNRCARLRAIGHGGQVLVSMSSAALVVDQLPRGTTLVDLGAHRLKDLGRSEHVWQAIGLGLPSEFPPLRSLDARRHNLPVQLTPLIGRTTEIAEVADLLVRERLVTLTGSAGVGKTRLAAAAAAELLERQPGSVWWVELAALSDPEAIGRATLAAVGAPDTPALPIAQQLAFELGNEPSLLVLDNCEHLSSACAALIAAVLAAAPSVSVLTTSREPLGVPGEITWRVPSLRCPARHWDIDVPSLSQYDAVVLFIDRARRARPSFRVTEGSAPAIAQICYRVDGIPLAIELAAARCRQMPAERIASELDDRFRLLTGGARTLMPRQQTLSASIDWSYERLDDREQLVFRRLGAFAGGFPLEAAEAVVASAGDVEITEVFEIVSRLVDKSLLIADDNEQGEQRYRLLESLRAYAVGRARAASELRVLRDAHADWWTDWLEPMCPLPTDAVLDDVAAFRDNLMAALEWSTTEPERGLRLLRCLARAWQELGWFGGLAHAFEQLVTTHNAQRHARAWLDAVFACDELVIGAHGQPVWVELIEQAERLARELGDDYRLAIARYFRGTASEAAALRDLARQRSDLYWQADPTIDLAGDLVEEDPVAARTLLSEAESMAAASGSRYLQDQALALRANAARNEGDLRLCIRLGQSVLQSGGTFRRPSMLHIVSYAALLAGDEDALRQVAEAGHQLEGMAPGFAVLAYNAAHRLALFERQPSAVHPELHERQSYWPASMGTLWLVCREAIDAGQGDIALKRARQMATSPHGRAVLAAAEGAASTDEDHWHEALALALGHDLRLIAVDALEGLGIAAARDESWAECLRLLTAAERLREHTGYRWRFTFEQQAVDAARTAATDALGEEACAKANREGNDLDWRAAAAYARRARGERRRPHHGWASLTPTEQQIAALVANGLTNPQIAQRLFIARSTVKTHLDHIYTKLSIRSRAELAAEATRRSPTD